MFLWSWGPVVALAPGVRPTAETLQALEEEEEEEETRRGTGRKEGRKERDGQTDRLRQTSKKSYKIDNY